MNKLDTYTACQQALKKYRSIWNLDGSHLWPIANQVHSYLRFAEIASKCYPTLVDPTNDIPWYYLLTNDNDDKLNFVENFFTILDNSSKNDDPWVDDYGWCGLACISVARTYKEQNITPPTNGHTWLEWRDMAFKCLTLMNIAALQNASIGGAPVPNGLSNCPIHATDWTKYVKNTVTNATYMLLAITLYDWCIKYPNGPPTSPTKQTCLNTAYNQYVWFRDWFRTRSNAPPGIWNEMIPFNYYHTKQNGIKTEFLSLIEDRPIAFPPGYTYSSNSATLDWSADGVWAGDQGLFLAAIALFYTHRADLANLINPPPGIITEVAQNTKAWFEDISRAIWVMLCNDTANNASGDFVLRDAPFSFTRSSGYVVDYMCGRGVLARFFSLESTRSVYQSLAQQSDWNRYDKCWATTAKVIRKTGLDNSQQLSAQWNGDYDPIANKYFFSKFGTVKGEAVTDFHWTWYTKAEDIPNPGTNEIAWWNNFCMMQGFDLYAAFLRTSDWYPSNTTGLVKVQQNGHVERNPKH
jgi:hypothetical protein